MRYAELEKTAEAIVFASGEPVTAERIAQVTGADARQVIAALEKLQSVYEEEDRGIRLVRTGDSFQMCSAKEEADLIIRALEKRRPPRLSQTSLEVLAIIAYFQPVTRAYIEQVRGTDSSYTVSLLADRGLIEPCGKLDVPGRPTLFRTTDLFLRTMGYENLNEMPPLPDLGSSEAAESLQAAIDKLRGGDAEQMRFEDNGEISN